jgi:large subunit ribosomal protein L31
MKDGIHPNYIEATVSCACGSSFKTRSTKPVIKLDICSSCHPFFTGRQKFVDTAGRVERFQKRFEKTSGETVKRQAPKTKLAKGQTSVVAKKKMKVLSSAPIVTAKPTGAKSAPKSTPTKAH